MVTPSSVGLAAQLPAGKVRMPLRQRCGHPDWSQPRRPLCWKSANQQGDLDGALTDRSLVGGPPGRDPVLIAFPLLVEPAAANPTPDMASIDAYLEQEMREVRIPGLALGIVHNDEVVHLRGFGEATRTDESSPPQTPFILALGVQVVHRAGDHAADGVRARWTSTRRWRDTSPTSGRRTRRPRHE